MHLSCFNVSSTGLMELHFMHTNENVELLMRDSVNQTFQQVSHVTLHACMGSVCVVLAVRQLTVYVNIVVKNLH